MLSDFWPVDRTGRIMSVDGLDVDAGTILFLA
jgi:hypothetical protein